ncbi:DUF3822 family protein [Algoriphagus vanfongensis]|uniref:DUF3822 family protein n=1 Tax=Algoriphagus vanfongensis TaxID=426371 RepID=UPI0004041AC9|nr:DUF3822 family protein [Algoriphagus vanfongensis]
MENTLKVFKSDKFDVEDTASLSLFLYPDFLVIFAKDQNQTNIGIHHYPQLKWEDLDHLILTDPLLKLDVPTRVYVHHSSFSLVPGVLYAAGNEEKFLSFAQQITSKPFYFNTPLDSNNLQIVSMVDEKLKKHLEARFSDLTFDHGASSFLSYLFKERFNLIGQEILINIFGDHMYLAAFTDQELSTFNLFSISSKEDILKYILIVIEQLGYERNLVRINLFGVPANSDMTEDWGKEYFLNFRLLKPHVNQNYPHGFKHLKDLGLFEVSWQYQ